MTDFRCKFTRKSVIDFFLNFSSFSSKHIDKQALSVYNIKRSVAEWCNGSTTDSDSVCWGSNPYSAAKNKTTVIDRGFIFYNGIRTRRERSGRKQSGGLFSPTWATSEARRRRRQARRSADNSGREQTRYIRNGKYFHRPCDRR